jgi:hypothetical protein
LVTVPDAASLDLTTGLTLEAWVYPTQRGGWRTVLLKEQAGDLVYDLYADSDTSRPRGQIYINGEKDTQGTTQIALNTWTHLAVTYDGTTLRLYVNGTQVASRSVSGAIRTSSRALRIGGNTIWGEYCAALRRTYDCY